MRLLIHNLGAALMRYEEIYLSYRPQLSSRMLIVLHELMQDNNRETLPARIGAPKDAIKEILHHAKKRGFISRPAEKGSGNKRTNLTALGKKVTVECYALSLRAEVEFLQVWREDKEQGVKFINLLADSTGTTFPSRSP